MIVDELKKGILDSAIQGKLTNREITDSSVKKTIKEIEDIRLNQQKLKLIDKKIINTKIFSEETEVKEYKIPTEWEFLNLGFISKVIVYPGENEVSALALNGLLVLKGKIEVRDY